jgi:8-oxo-dGTP pyrophosphatase MutT (NUDIX family)
VRNVVGCAIIKNKTLVVVRKEKEGKSSWILPGGKPEPGESDLACLVREIFEELPHLILSDDFYYYRTFSGISPNRGDAIEARVYYSQPTNRLDLAVNPDENEPIKEARQAAYDELLHLNLSDVTRKTVESLRQDSYI